MSFRIGLRPLLVCSALFSMASVASAQVKVGLVNLQQAVFETAEIKKADAEMQAKFKPRQEKLQQTQDQIARIGQQLQSGQGKLTPQAESDLQVQGTRLQRDAQRMQEDLQADVTADRNEILAAASKRMVEIVKKLAEQKGFDLVVDTNTAYYFKAPMEFTSEATAAFDKAYPVAAAPAGK